MLDETKSRIRSKSPQWGEKSSITEEDLTKEERTGDKAVRDSRGRSRSPRGDHRHHRQKRIAGFRWKEKRQPDDSLRDQDYNFSATTSSNHIKNSSSTTHRLERGYRDRSRSPLTRRHQDEIRSLDDNKKSSSVAREKDYNIEEKFGSRNSNITKKSKSREKENDCGEEKKSRLMASSHSNSSEAMSGGRLQAGGGTGQQQEPMIIVHVNDRLGTRAAIPCLASDPIGLFKAQVAARIGRQPHEIMLKRQGERPFKDQLTLEDYGISNGVQIDLEIDTGD